MPSAMLQGVPLPSRGDLPLTEQLPRRRVDGRKGMSALVDIRSDHDHPARPYPLAVERQVEMILTVRKPFGRARVIGRAPKEAQRLVSV